MRKEETPHSKERCESPSPNFGFPELTGNGRLSIHRLLALIEASSVTIISRLRTPGWNKSMAKTALWTGASWTKGISMDVRALNFLTCGRNIRFYDITFNILVGLCRRPREFSQDLVPNLTRGVTSNEVLGTYRISTPWSLCSLSNRANLNLSDNHLPFLPSLYYFVVISSLVLISCLILGAPSGRSSSSSHLHVF